MAVAYGISGNSFIIGMLCFCGLGYNYCYWAFLDWLGLTLLVLQRGVLALCESRAFVNVFCGSCSIWWDLLGLSLAPVRGGCCFGCFLVECYMVCGLPRRCGGAGSCAGCGFILCRPGGASRLLRHPYGRRVMGLMCVALRGRAASERPVTLTELVMNNLPVVTFLHQWCNWAHAGPFSFEVPRSGLHVAAM